MNYLSLSRDSFEAWCAAVKITSYKYEFSNRTYFISGEFYALADEIEINRIKELHGDRWTEYYSKFVDVLPFLVERKSASTPSIKYTSKSEDVADFINSLREL